MTAVRRRIAIVSGVIAMGVFGIVAFYPAEVCGCISPDMRFRNLFGTSAAEDARSVRDAIAKELPLGSTAQRVHAACTKINDSVRPTACRLQPHDVVCGCAFRISASLLGWHTRGVELRFYADDRDELRAVDIAQTGSWF